MVIMPGCERPHLNIAPARARVRQARYKALHAIVLAASLALLAWTGSGCGILWVTRHVKKLAPHPAMLNANAPELLSILQKEADAIRTLNAKVELRVSTGGPKSGIITKYRQVTAYLIISKPNNIRLIGTLSILGTIFDMASTGNQFELYIPEKGKFYTGLNNVVPPGLKNPLERLRPQVILESLLINPVRSTQQVAMMNDRAESAAEYELLVFEPGQNRVDRLARRVIFSRYNLLPLEQIIYDNNGFPATRVSYSRYHLTQGVWMPQQILIIRPIEEYSIQLKFHHPQLNQPIAPNKFLLPQPPGTKLIRLSFEQPRVPAEESQGEMGSRSRAHGHH